MTKAASDLKTCVIAPSAASLKRLCISGALALTFVQAVAAFGPEHIPGAAEDERSHLEIKPAERSPEAPRWIAELTELVHENRIHEASQLCRSVLWDDPENNAAYTALVRLAARLRLSDESSAREAAEKRLTDGFQVHQTERFILLSDASAMRTRQHARLVERTWQEFHRFAQECGLRPLPLRHKLVCVLFEDQEEFRTFARLNDGMVNPAFSGYYSPRHDRVVFSLGETARGGGDLAEAEADDDSTPGSSGRSVLGFEGADERAAARLRAPGHASACCSESVAKCAHETIHQLMFHTRIMAREVQYPLWICEGLSTAFETESAEGPFGPDRDYGPRRRVFEDLAADGELLPLRELVVCTQLPADDPSLVRAVYHQSYALVTWLCRQRPAGLRSYLSAMLTERPGRLPAQRHLELFEQAFGDVDEVERAWARAETLR